MMESWTNVYTMPGVASANKCVDKKLWIESTCNDVPLMK